MKKNAIWFLSVVLFFGILLTMTLYVGFGVPLLGEKEGSEMEYRLNRSFLEDENIRSFIRYVDYKLFGHLEGDEIVLGREDWLYEAVDAESDFNYLLDYVSGCPFTDAECSAIGDMLVNRASSYRNRGVEYLLVVIPSTYTACGEYLPAYLGAPNENTRLASLSRALTARGVSCFLDLSEEMRAEEGQGARYHNTENSINAYGGFAVYDAVMSALEARGIETEPYRMTFEEIEYTTHYTEGKEIARRVGLEQVIPNRTVSLTNQLNGGYVITDTTEHCVCSRMNEDYTGCETGVVVEFSEKWDRIQLTPYFSSTFEVVAYENRITDGEEAVAYHGANVLIQIIHEDELGLLLP